jgi:drug/metabolite transporter (DMT)-like permease
MLYLVASIISSTAIFVIFRVAKNYSCKLGHLITLNYLTATIFGFSLMMRFSLRPFHEGIQWIPFAVFLGILFIAMFYLIGLSSQKAGITVTTLANKLSLVFPVFFSLIWFNETITSFKYIGLATAIAAVIATLYKKDLKKVNPSAIVLPLVIFIGSGFTDSYIKYIQATQISVIDTGSFSTLVFFAAFICGAVLLFSNSGSIISKLTIPTLLLGILLGMANFGSLYFFINALNKSGLGSSLVFTINNLMIVALSAAAGHFIFREQINRVNLAGFILAFLSMYILL